MNDDQLAEGGGMISFEQTTSRQEQMIDIGKRVQEIVTRAGLEQGVCRIFVPHTTAAVTVNENADPDVQHDIFMSLASIVKDLPGFRHAGGNSTAHMKASLIGSSAHVFVEDGLLCFGTWQGLFLCDFDGPRRRQIWVDISET